MGSFIALSFNPMKWDLSGRSIFAFTGTLFAAVITVVLNDYEDDKWIQQIKTFNIKLGS